MTYIYMYEKECSRVGHFVNHQPALYWMLRVTVYVMLWFGYGGHAEWLCTYSGHCGIVRAWRCVFYIARLGKTIRVGGGQYNYKKFSMLQLSLHMLSWCLNSKLHQSIKEQRYVHISAAEPNLLLHVSVPHKVHAWLLHVCWSENKSANMLWCWMTTKRVNTNSLHTKHMLWWHMFVVDKQRYFFITLATWSLHRYLTPQQMRY